MRRFAARFALVCLLVAGPSAPLRAQGESLTSLLNAINESSGAPYRYHIHSVEQNLLAGAGVSTTDKSVTSVDERGPAYIRKRCDRELCSGFFFDGTRGYQVDINASALPTDSEGDALRATLRAVESYAFTDPEFGAHGGRIVEQREGRQADGLVHLIVTAPAGVPLDVAIEHTGQTLMLVKSASTLDGSLRIGFADERPLTRGVMLPYALETNDQTLVSFDDRAIVDEPFAPPAGLVPHFSAGPASVKMEGARPADPPVVACSIGGITVACLLDTGNSGMSLSLELAEQLNLEPVAAPFEVRGLGAYETGLVKAPPLSIGSVTYPSARYVVLHDVHRLGYDVILGADFFAHAQVTLDFPRRTLRLAPEELLSSHDAGAIPIRFVNNVPVVDVQLAGVDARLAIDTGDESAINLSEGYAKLHPTLFKPTGATQVGGIGGHSEEVTGEIASVRIGSLALERERIGITKGLAATGQGHLGTAFLARFALAIDYARERITLEPTRSL